MNLGTLLLRFISWVIDRLAFLAVGAVALFLISQLDRRLGLSGPDSVGFDVTDLLAVQLPLSLVVTYAIWLLVLYKFGPPGRRLTRTEVRRHRGGNASPLRQMARAVIKIALHLSIIGLIVDAVFIIRDQRERRSVSDIMAGTVVVGKR